MPRQDGQKASSPLKGREKKRSFRTGPWKKTANTLLKKKKASISKSIKERRRKHDATCVFASRAES